VGDVTDIANRLNEDDQFTYLYDANGNLTSKTDKAALETTGYTYDAQDRLTRIDFPDLTTAAYRYDGLGRRIEKDANGAVTRYVYDGSDILLEFDGAGALLARTSHGQGTDQPLAVERGGQEFFYHADHQGSVRKITDSAGLVVNSYDYDSYGNVEASFEGIANPFTYTGRELDAESGLYYYRARYYDPATGRFLQEDPIGFGAGDLNLYRYVFNDPVNRVDPSGRAVFLLPAVPVIVTALADAAAFVGSALLTAKLLNEIAKGPEEESGPDEGAGAGPGTDPGVKRKRKDCPDGGDQTSDDGDGDGDGDGNENKSPEIFDPEDPLKGTKKETLSVKDQDIREFEAMERAQEAAKGDPQPGTTGEKALDAIQKILDVLGNIFPKP